MKPLHFLRLVALSALIFSAGAARAVEYVSVGESGAILYDAPSSKAKKLFVVNRYMPFEQVITLESWIKVRDSSGGLYWVEKRDLSNKRYVFALLPLVDVRAAPNSGSPRLFQVRRQVALEFVQSTGTGWIRVRHQDGNTGYVRRAEVWGG
jgi:SH3 domain protein